MKPRFTITNHALERWRERSRANGTQADMLAVLSECRRVTNEPTPFIKMAGTAYYHHAATDAYFVCAFKTAKVATVLTVLVHDVCYACPQKRTRRRRRV